jgi:ribosomal protein L5
MYFLTSFYLTTIKYYVTNKFIYKKINMLPKLDKIILSLNSKKINNKKILSGLLMFELITDQKGCIKKTKIVTVTIRNGNCIKSKLILKKQNLFKFFFTLLINLGPLLDTNLFKLNKNSILLKIHNTFTFFKLEAHYYFFNLLSKTNITIITTSKNKKEAIFFYKLFFFKTS